MYSYRSHTPSVFVLAAAVLGTVVPPAAWASAGRRPALCLQATAQLGVASGGTASLQVKLENESSSPLWLNPIEPAAYLFAIDGNVAPTRYGRRVLRSFWSPLNKQPGGPSPWVAPEKWRTWPSFPLAKMYDITLPGTYRLRITTQSRLYAIAGAAAVYHLTGYKRTGSVLYWPTLGAVVARSHSAERLPPTISKSIVVTVTAPYGIIPPAALELAATHSPGDSQPKGPRLKVRQLTSGNAMPVMLRIWLRAGSTPLGLRLTGNPVLDFRRVRVAGPDGINGDHLVAKPKPHYAPIPNWKQVPLAAYGKWLLKHPPKKMPTKRYTLKSGVVYRYAVPINLSCEYDMSLAGVYHVRVELAHPKIWSNWVNITVP